MMDEERVLELWIRYLTNEPLSPEERKELARALESDEALARELQEDARLDGLLFAKGWSAASEETFARGLRERLHADGDATRFLQKVRSGIRKREKPPTRRIHGIQLRRSGPGVIFSAVAAAAVFLIILILSVPSSSPERRPRKAAPALREAQAVRPNDLEGAVKERERAEGETKRAEQELQTAQRREAEAQREREQAKQEELARAAEAALQKSKADREAAEKRLAEAREQERLAAERASRPPEPAKTRVAIAKLEKVLGEVSIVAGQERTPPREGQDLLENHGLETAGGASAAVVYPDKTRVELGAETVVCELNILKGKRLTVMAGRVTANVSRQPAGQPMVFVTPHGEATVLGTTLRLTVDAKTGTRLEVTEGKVRLKNLAGATVDVSSGHYAIAAAGVELVARPILPDTPVVKTLTEKGEVTINFGPEGLELPAGILNDSGEEFDLKRGYGWIGPKQGKELPGITYRDYNTGKIEQVRAGRGAAVRTNALTAVGPLRATAVAAGWLNHSETWVMPFPNGRYRVTLCVGDAGAPGSRGYQGPHHIAIEGRIVIDSVSTPKGEFHLANGVVEIKDGEFTMIVGAPRKIPVGADKSSDTSLNYIIIESLQRNK